MKIRTRWLVVAFTLSLCTTFLLHAYVYYNYEKLKASRSNFEQHQPRRIIQAAIEIFRTQSQVIEDIHPHNDIIIDDVTRQSTNQIIEDDPLEDEPEPTELCELFPPELKGNLTVDSSFHPTEEEAMRAAGNYVIEGFHRPRGCISRQKVAVVIPYKNRREHLLSLLHHLHPVLQRQKIMYHVFVAEQFDNGVFNKARVMNAAFVEINKHWTQHGDPSSRPFDCFVYHDVDMLVENDFNLYNCADFPKHMSPAIDKFNYTCGYGTKYGGVTAIKTKHYELVNGHSNKFWGWGGEDNDMEERISANGMNITVVNEAIGRYKMIEHIHPWWFNPESGTGSYYRKSHDRQRKQTKPEKPEDKVDHSGISDIKYTLIETQRHKLWTKLTLDIRYHVIEKILIHMVGYGSELEVQSFDSLNSPEKHKNKNVTEIMLEDHCVPTYHKFHGMTLNHTTGGNDEAYLKVYYSIEEATEKCNIMRSYCHAIVEQIKGRFTLRPTAFVQENTLIYKLGLSQQQHITENHHSMAVYVKLCPNNPTYTQFFTEPIVLKGDAETGTIPRYYLEFYIRSYHTSNTYYSYNSQIMTTHRAVMEEKYSNQAIMRTWWDSLGKIHFGRTKLVNMSNPDVINSLTLEKDAHSRLIRFRTPVTGILRQTGCFLVKNQLVDDVSGATALAWNWWVQLRARDEKTEKEFLENTLKRSMLAGSQFNEMMSDRKAAVNVFQDEKRAQEQQRRKEEYARAIVAKRNAMKDKT